jgi:hypothetical protein
MNYIEPGPIAIYVNPAANHPWPFILAARANKMRINHTIETEAIVLYLAKFRVLQ